MDDTPDRLEHLVQLVLAQAGAEVSAAPIPGRVLLARTDLAALTPSQALARRIDHTLLKPEATRAQIVQLCQEAREFEFASVCVNPVYVPLCAELLRGTPVLVCTVAGFPLGACSTEAKAFEAEEAVFEGAAEVDMVLNVGALKSGDYETVTRDILAVVRNCHAQGAGVKVIIEAALLSGAEKEIACRIARQVGADFVKTSTGFGPGGATREDVALMRRVVGPEMGVKAAGGIRTLGESLAMLDAGATRLGASAGVRLVQEMMG